MKTVIIATKTPSVPNAARLAWTRSRKRLSSGCKTRRAAGPGLLVFGPANSAIDLSCVRNRLRHGLRRMGHAFHEIDQGFGGSHFRPLGLQDDRSAIEDDEAVGDV